MFDFPFLVLSTAAQNLHFQNRFPPVSDKYNSFHWELLRSFKVGLSQVYINVISDVIVSNLSLKCRLENVELKMNFPLRRNLIPQILTNFLTL